MYSYGSLHMAAQKQDDQHERTFSSYVRIRDVVLKTYLGRWTIGRSGERGSGISVLPAWYDDDDDIEVSWKWIDKKDKDMSLNNLQNNDNISPQKFQQQIIFFFCSWFICFRFVADVTPKKKTFYYNSGWLNNLYLVFSCFL